MEIVRIPKVMQETSKGHILHGRSIGFVPTMGALHEGHLSLVRVSRQENDITVVSIFVNPMQFGPSEDYNQYPRDFEGDMEKLRREGVDILFLPDKDHMYPEGFSTNIEVSNLSHKLCGAFRPGHFRGVATVVTKLFNIVIPTRAYFGQKDYQQSLIIKRLVRDLDMNIDIVICPTVREEDGLAMSSRNLYLSEKERTAATVLYRALQAGYGAIKAGVTKKEEITKIMRDIVESEPLVSEIQYLSVYDPDDLEELEVINKRALLAGAIKIGKTRLIDNIVNP
ncbi:MAG: pantoate--beta-alanine ligase [Thermodesulfovibrionales bacterium]